MHILLQNTKELGLEATRRAPPSSPAWPAAWPACGPLQPANMKHTSIESDTLQVRATDLQVKPCVLDYTHREQTSTYMTRRCFIDSTALADSTIVSAWPASPHENGGYMGRQARLRCQTCGVCLAQFKGDKLAVCALRNRKWNRAGEV
jgi:hypothetical protein